MSKLPDAAWTKDAHPALLEEILADGVVRCGLSPRKCVIKPGQHGFCGVRANREGRLVTLNYGKSVHATEETIETEAVNHFAPGERILSMGNIGCMMACSYCHNWKTSQARHVADADVHYYSPAEVVAIAQRHGIRCISWTYNDPVVWHEFVLETAKLAREAGIVNLYKSAFYISPEAVDDLLPFIDIFSISIKSMDPRYYQKITTGRLEPVLAATRQAYLAGKHVEISTLMVTGLSDDEQTARKVAHWVLTELDSTVPLHFVRFHPDFRMRDTVRTPIPKLLRAREVALDLGMEHVYLGNVYDTPYTNTVCGGCGQMLVTRYGLNEKVLGLNDSGLCTACGRDAHFKLLAERGPAVGIRELPAGAVSVKSFDWRGDIRSVHVQARNPHASALTLHHRRRHAGKPPAEWSTLTLQPQESYRFILAQAGNDEVGVEVAVADGIVSNLHEVFDRAHFPTVDVTAAKPETDVSPLPIYPGRQLAVRRI